MSPLVDGLLMAHVPPMSVEAEKQNEKRMQGLYLHLGSSTNQAGIFLASFYFP